MIIDLHSFFNKFNEADIPTWDVKINHTNKSLWLHKGNESIQMMINDDYDITRFYHMEENKTFVKVAFDISDDNLFINVLSEGSHVLVDAKIKEISTIKSEEGLFQRSVIEDLYNVEYSDLVKLKTIVDSLKAKAKEHIKEVY